MNEKIDFTDKKSIIYHLSLLSDQDRKALITSALDLLVMDHLQQYQKNDEPQPETHC